MIPAEPLLSHAEELRIARRVQCSLSRLRGFLPRHPHGYRRFLSRMESATTGGHAYFPCSRPRSWFFPSGYGTLGWALPAAIGARLAAPERATVVLAGDGGFLFTVQELGTAVEMGLPIAIVLWNNDGLGEIRDNMVARGIPEIGVNPRNPDYVALAEAFGARATRPDSLDAFKAALNEAFAADGPTLIEMREDAPFLD